MSNDRGIVETQNGLSVSWLSVSLPVFLRLIFASALIELLSFAAGWLVLKLHYFYSEDGLYLNLFTPSEAKCIFQGNSTTLTLETATILEFVRKV